MPDANGEIRLSFLGAAKSVTGSRYLLETPGARILIDCGLHQERSQQGKNWEPLPVPPDRIDAVLLTHAHLDHCGLLPRLVREGFRGSVYATAPTAEIGTIVMNDSARLQAEDLKMKRERHAKDRRESPHPLVLLYDEKDAAQAAARFKIVRYGEIVEVAEGVSADFHEAGHILGSASIRVRVGNGGTARAVLFSGDIGRWNKPILKDPDPCDGADYLLMESTYGDRLHGSEEEIERSLETVIKETVSAGGNVVIPSFAIERSQDVLYHLNALLLADRIPHLLVFLDSPMATRVTDVFGRYPEFFDEEMNELIRSNQSPFDLPGLIMARSAEQSKAINRITGSAIIIAGSGMCTGGRIKHHLARNIVRPESCILFVGYQAEGTLGRQIAEGARHVRIFGETLPLRARVRTIGGFSAHADRDELLRWASRQSRPPRETFVVHGEPEVAMRFAASLREKMRWQASVPSPGDSVVLST